MSKNKDANKSTGKLVTVAAVAIFMVIVVFGITSPDKSNSSQKSQSDIPVANDQDIVIQAKDVTEEPSFYPAIIDGVNLEIIAVKASDGTIRTAFNTCQVCYGSGQGYYEVDGGNLVCQNCGNRFGMDEVEVTKGGCNPVPITSDYKIVSEDTITVPKELLEQAIVIFEDWK